MVVIKMEKLNAKIIVKCTSKEKANLQEVADKLNISLNLAARSLLNKALQEIKYKGIEKFGFRLVEV
jgi:hypothetical protein